MINKKDILFDNALDIAKNVVIKKAKEIGTLLGNEIFLVRDLRGRIRVLLEGKREDYYAKDKKENIQKLTLELTNNLGNYGFPKDSGVLFTGEFLQVSEIISPSNRRLIIDEEGVKIWFLDRQVIGQDWMRSPLPRQTKNRRVTFFGIKGGVGRSTALIIWAWHLAKQGKRVLIFDLDLESPGVSSTLLPTESLPDFGIVDWFVEDGVGQKNIVEQAMVASSPLSKDLPNEIRIVPAFGRETSGREKGDYLPKLARCYTEFSGNQSLSWAERLQGMVEQMEKNENPDLVILDSRAGLHDIAAVSVTRMDAKTFLFAVDSIQTWNAYSFLFRHWKHHPQVREFRQKLQVVAGMVPETGRNEYFKRFKENSWDLFRDSIYDEVEVQSNNAFNFDIDDEVAPHFPLPIYWNRALQEFDPIQNASHFEEQIIEAAMGKFITEAQNIVFPDEEKA